MVVEVKLTVEQIIPYVAHSFNGDFLYKNLGQDGVTYYHFERWTADEKKIRDTFAQMVNDGECYLDPGEVI